MTSLINFDTLGADYISDLFGSLTEHVEHLTPVQYNEAKRYLSRSETPLSGYMDFSLTPYWIEPLNRLDTFDDAREIVIKKGVKTSYNTTGIEGGLFYLAGHLRAFPSMFVTADKEMAQSRMETNVIPMFQNADMDIFRSADIDSTSKTGKTKKLLQWMGGGYCIPEGAKNADKMRMYGAMYLWLDELDSFVQSVGKDGDPVQLLKDRCSGFWNMRKIMMGSTPLLKGSSQIDRQFERGDQRKYNCRCLKCGYPQSLRWSIADLQKPETKRGMIWEYTAGGQLDVLSIRYECKNCGHGHDENSKEKFINKDNCEWKPTATPIEPGIYSYHMPSTLSRLQPWSKQVSMWLSAYSKKGKVKNIEKLQVFYNNVLGESFEVTGAKISFSAVSGHRRPFYKKGEIPNAQIEMYCKSHVMFLCMTVDVHLHNLAVAVWGVTVGGNTWLVDYKRLVDETEIGCGDIESPTWGEVRRMIDEQEYTADDGKKYRLAITLIDSGYSESTVSDFTSEWDTGVYPIVGRSSSAVRINEFREFTTGSGKQGYMIDVDYYKDRLAPVLRRDWTPQHGDQGRYQLNTPIDTTDKELKELTREYKREKRLPNGTTKRYWYRPHGADNELWDLLVYANGALDILANLACTQNLELEETDFQSFWEYAEEQQLFYSVD
jgi:phage terminase large subunit GpA-like protein